MPKLEQELTKLTDSRFFATSDLYDGYWQLPFDRNSEKVQYFSTPDGIYSPNRVLHGTKTAVRHLQSSLANITTMELRKRLLNWPDDTLLHEPPRYRITESS